MDQKAYNEKLKQAFPPSPFASSQVPNPTGSNSVALYLCNLSLAPGIIKLITSAGYMIEGSVKSGSDYSYSASCYAGNHYRIVGDAGGRSFSFSFSSWFPYGRFSFHRPLLFQRYPSQLYVGFIGRCYDLCFYSWRLLRIWGSSVAYRPLIVECNKVCFRGWYNHCPFSHPYRFLIVVLSAYKQIRAQSTDVLSDVNENNYDRAFAFLRPSKSLTCIFALYFSPGLPQYHSDPRRFRHGSSPLRNRTSKISRLLYETILSYIASTLQAIVQFLQYRQGTTGRHRTCYRPCDARARDPCRRRE